FLALVGLLVGEQLLEERWRVEVVVCNLRVLEDDRGAVVPTAVFGGMVARCGCENLQDAAHFNLFLEDGIVVLFEQGDELVRVSPFRLVVVLHHKWAVVGRCRRVCLWHGNGEGKYECDEQESCCDRETLHSHGDPPMRTTR